MLLQGSVVIQTDLHGLTIGSTVLHQPVANIL